MIRCHLSRFMGERKMKIVDVARVTGLHRNTITLLYNETATRIDLDTVDKLCKLFGARSEIFLNMWRTPNPEFGRGRH